MKPDLLAGMSVVVITSPVKETSPTPLLDLIVAENEAVRSMRSPKLQTKKWKCTRCDDPVYGEPGSFEHRHTDWSEQISDAYVTVVYS